MTRAWLLFYMPCFNFDSTSESPCFYFDNSALLIIVLKMNESLIFTVSLFLFLFIRVQQTP